MQKQIDTIQTEESCAVPFIKKTGISIERGQGVYAWDEGGKKYMDLTSGWGVTSIGHANPVITEALLNQSKKIMQNPDSGMTYSPARAQLLNLLKVIFPENLTRIFFASSGAEANDAVIKLARKVSGKKNVISTKGSFHGRTISTASATGQKKHRDKYNPLMPYYNFIPFNDINALSQAITDDTAAVILEPIQGEGGIIVPSDDYLIEVSKLCVKKNVFLIIDEIQTGFYRTGPLFASGIEGVKIDFLTMAKGIAGGFPFGAFAMTEEIAQQVAYGDHGGTYCGNPLGCAVAYSVVSYLLEHNIEENVKRVGAAAREKLNSWKQEFPELISDVRGRGLLLVLEFAGENSAAEIAGIALEMGLICNVNQGKNIRIFPALTITEEEMDEGLGILKKAVESFVS
ncbi:MAG: aspartate aminotransferase family protein [bacterium]|nr:aspartate aminotransferase family protein [bacterium]